MDDSESAERFARSALLSDEGNSAAMSGCPDLSRGFPSFPMNPFPSHDPVVTIMMEDLSALLERRKQLLNNCRALRFRMETARLELPPDMLNELISIKDRLFQCEDTVLIGEFSSELSCYI